MFAYYLRLACKSLLRNPLISVVMVVTIALGIGVSTTTATIYHLMSRNPIPQKSDRLFYVRMDNWIDGPYGYWEPEDPPEQLTYRDAVALLEDARGVYQSASFNADILVYPQAEGKPPYEVRSRVVSPDFFPMFDIPFRYGGPWDADSEQAGEQVVVLSQQENDKLFGGENSVGEELRLEDRVFRVVGVLGDWLPIPKFYDVQGGQDFNDLEALFVPFTTGIDLGLTKGSGSTSCPEEAEEGRQGFLDSECIWIQYWVQLDSAAEAEAYLAYLDAYVGEQKELGRFPRPLMSSITPVMEWLTYMRVVADDSRVLLGLALMFLGVCLLNAVGLLLDKFLGRPGEIALRRALGASRGAMFTQHLVEVGLVGIVGGLLGIGVGLLGLRGIDKLYRGLSNLVSLDWTTASVAILAALAATLLAGIYPSWKSCRLPPAQHLKTQ